MSENRILCMYSGGLDSLGALYLLLTDEAYRDFSIHVHHLNLVNIENRAKAEQKAVDASLKYFRTHDYRSFYYTISRHDYTFMRKYFIFDTYWYAFMAANIMTADRRILHVAVGRTKTDIESASSMTNANRGHEIFHATLPLELRWNRSYIYPVAHLTKKEIWNMLPPELRNVSWGCRRPVYVEGEPAPCNTCDTCEALRKIKGSPDEPA